MRIIKQSESVICFGIKCEKWRASVWRATPLESVNCVTFPLSNVVEREVPGRSRAAEDATDAAAHVEATGIAC